jgi:hypothetical protein
MFETSYSIFVVPAQFSLRRRNISKHSMNLKRGLNEPLL